MARQSTFTTKLQLVNHVLNQLYSNPLTSLAAGSDNELQEYIATSLNKFTNYVFGKYPWRFASSTFACTLRPNDSEPYAKSIWELPGGAANYLRLNRVFLREGLDYLKLSYKMLSNGYLATNFVTTGVSDLTHALYVNVVLEPDIQLWPVNFTALFENSFKQTIAQVEGGQYDLANQCVQLDPYYLNAAIREDELLENADWCIPE